MTQFYSPEYKRLHCNVGTAHDQHFSITCVLFHNKLFTVHFMVIILCYEIVVYMYYFNCVMNDV